MHGHLNVKFITMHGHMNVKFGKYSCFIFERSQVQTSLPRLPIVTLSMLYSVPQNTSYMTGLLH